MSECLKCGEADETFCACGRQSEMAVASSELAVPPEAGMDFSEYALRSWVNQGAEFTVKNSMGEMRIDGGVRRVLQLLDAERQRHNND